MKLFKLLLSLITILFIVSACGDDDTAPEGPKFSEQDLLLLHNGSSKTWTVKALYLDYSDNIKSEDEACHLDDVYTFKADMREADVALGNISCYWQEPDDQAAIATYTYYPESGQLFLDHGRSESKGSEFGAILYIMELEEISETRAVFASGTEGNWGRALILESNE